MDPRSILRSVVIAATMSLSLTSAGSMARDATMQQRWRQRSIATLSRMPDADALAAATLLAIPDRRLAGNSTTSTARWLAQASARAPMAADLATLAITRCLPASSGCNSTQLERHLRQVDPGNAMGWLGALNRAERNNDAVATRRALAGMARTRTLDLYIGRLDRRVAGALARLPAPPGATAAGSDNVHERVEITAANLVAASAIPPLQSIVRPCRHGARHQRRQWCRAIARAMTHSDAAIVAVLGARMLTWLAPNVAARSQAEQRYRRVSWRVQRYIRLAAEQGSGRSLATTFGRRNELDAMGRALTDAGISLTPPAHWTAPGERSPTRSAQ